VESQKWKAKSPDYFRWVLVVMATACLLLLVSIYPLIFRLVDDSSSIGLRNGIEIGKGDSTDTKRSDGQKKGPASFAKLAIIYQNQNSQSFESINILQSQKDKLILTQEDNYKLSFQTVDDRFIYIYQLDPRGTLAKLFPNNNYIKAQNPILKERTYIIPPRSNWFYLNSKGGKEQLYIVSSAYPMANLENIYTQYETCKSHMGRMELLSRLLKEFDTIDKTNVEMFIWEFTFKKS